MSFSKIILPKLTISNAVISDKRIFSLTWTNEIIDANLYGRVKKWVFNSNDYSPINSKHMQIMADFADDYNTDVDVVVSIRNIAIKDKIISNYERMNAMIAKISREYDHFDILQLSAKYDFPPINLLRGILMHTKMYSNGLIYKIFSEKEPANLLNDRDMKQYKLAANHDAENYFDQNTIAKIAALNEERVVNYFRSLGIRLVDQYFLAAEQKLNDGRATLTPDILFLDEVYINNSRVHWLDYKDYVGTNMFTLLNSNIEQAKKYANKWGPGAMCYHRSFVDNLSIPGAILLDGNALPILLDK